MLSTNRGTDVSDIPEPVAVFGCGYVGEALARVLVGEGVRVGALTRNPAQAERLRQAGVGEVALAELPGDGTWSGVLKAEYASVVNCLSPAGRGPEGYRQSYIGGQQAILEWARRKGVRRYVQTGSTSVYPQDGGPWVTESAPTEGASETGAVILESERMLREAEDAFESWVILRLAGIYGPGRHYLLDRLREGVAVLPGSGGHHLNLVHRDDIVTALLASLRAGAEKTGVYNIADGHPERKDTVVSWLAAQLGSPPPRFDPEQSTDRLRRRGGRMPDRKIANAKARETLGWVPMYPSFRDGYRNILSLS